MTEVIEYLSQCSLYDDDLDPRMPAVSPRVAHLQATVPPTLSIRSCEPVHAYVVDYLIIDIAQITTTAITMLLLVFDHDIYYYM